MSESESNTNTSCLQSVQKTIVSGLENFFSKYGEAVARKPWYFILACFVFTGLCGAGLVRFRAENEGIKLWIPRNSDFRLNNDWLFEHFPRSLRFNSLILITDGNILTPEVIQTMWKIKKGVDNIDFENS